MKIGKIGSAENHRLWVRLFTTVVWWYFLYVVASDTNLLINSIYQHAMWLPCDKRGCKCSDYTSVVHSGSKDVR